MNRSLSEQYLRQASKLTGKSGAYQTGISSMRPVRACRNKTVACAKAFVGPPEDWIARGTAK